MTHQALRGPDALLDDYAAIASRRRRAVMATAVRTGSPAYQDLLAHMASEGRLDLEGTLTEATCEQPRLAPRWAADLGRVIALQAMTPEERGPAVPLLEYAIRSLDGGTRAHAAKLLHEIHFEAGRFVEAQRILESVPDLQSSSHRYLAVDLLNPATASPYSDRTRWMKGFRALFEEHGLEPPVIDQGAQVPFDGLLAPDLDRIEDGPLVSVIMTSFNPTWETLSTSVRSIMSQTWSNLELIIVDDHSPDEGARETLARVADLDPRIHVKILPSNGGTYVARNAGIELARGDFFTGQDDDDWSHPRRVERQLAPLLADPNLPATRSSHIPARSNLTIQRVGYRHLAPNASSTMFRVGMIRDLGGFIPTRKASDTELLLRVESHSGHTALTMKEPLALVRIRDNSLSRSDFRPGWKHPSRSAYRSAYRQWHRDNAPDKLRVRGASPVPVPALISGRPGPRMLDVIFAGDWCSFGGPQKSMIEEIEALRAVGLSVGVLHLEAARFMSPDERPLCAPIQQRINRGDVAHVIDDDEVATRLAVLRYPPILQFPPAEPLGMSPERLIILANQAPSERDGSDIRYDPATVADNAERTFGVRGQWVPQGPTVRGTLFGLADHEIAPFDMPGILDANRWRTERKSYRGLRPVVGRHSRDNRMKWPGTSEDLLAAYPTDGSFDVRIMGGIRSALATLDAGAPPAAWLCLPKDALPVRTFLNSLDFFVYFQHPQAYDAFGRSVLEALAAGTVAVLPHHMEPTFGDAAVYCHVGEVRDVVGEIYANPERYRAQAELAMTRVAERFSRERYAGLVQEVLSHDVSGLKAPSAGRRAG